MIKYFCDECEKELSKPEIDFSYEMIGAKLLCFEHATGHITNKNNIAYARIQKLEKEWLSKND
jgi:hypothetical protein